ncbi:hypothetical protein ILYODFUR_015054 [Ilyodon furcidens]|uniref:PH domain-containing protein n=1 Tax=Ilyodon furcidens TaxID=33524 RepID=A0ABV0VEF0_9TELE
MLENKDKKEENEWLKSVKIGVAVDPKMQTTASSSVAFILSDDQQDMDWRERGEDMQQRSTCQDLNP